MTYDEWHFEKRAGSHYEKITRRRFILSSTLPADLRC